MNQYVIGAMIKELREERKMVMIIDKVNPFKISAARFKNPNLALVLECSFLITAITAISLF